MRRRDSHKHIIAVKQAQLLNQVIDRALIQADASSRQDILGLVGKQDVERLSERIRRRATWLGRHKRQQALAILATRDELIMALYSALAPEGWASAWCDGSSIKNDTGRHAGIGVILFDATGKRITEISRHVGNKSAFAAEVAALAATLETAREYNIERIVAHTDSKAIAQLWNERREDPRLEPVRRLTSPFKRILIRAIPRKYNQAAHLLARKAAMCKYTLT